MQTTPMDFVTKGLAYTKRTFRYSSNKGFIWPKEWANPGIANLRL